MEGERKKGQVTVFIIIAIVIIALIVLFFIFRGSIGLGGGDSVDEKDMHNLIEECVSTGLISGARLIGLQGGYLELPEKVVELNLSKIAYGYYLGSKTLNSKSRIENEISNYIDLILPYCFDETQFIDYSITKGDSNSDVSINKDSISTSTKFSISATKGDFSFTINKNFDVKVPINLDSIYDIAEEIINKEIENPNSIELSYLADLDYSVSIIPYTNDIIIYSIMDENEKDPDYYYVFMFANRLD